MLWKISLLVFSLGAVEEEGAEAEGGEASADLQEAER